MGTFCGLWIDDDIPIPDKLVEYGWTGARSGWEGLFKLELLEFQEVSISKNMRSKIGDNKITCMNIILWLDNRHNQGLYVPPKILVHTDASIGVPHNVYTTHYLDYW